VARFRITISGNLPDARLHRVAFLGVTRRRRARQTAAVTPPGERSPTVRRRRLARRLLELREQAGLTVPQAARELGWADTTLYRIESAERGTVAGNVALMVELYASRGAAVAPGERQALMDLAKDARKRGWWVGYGLAESFATYVGLEAEATQLLTYQIQLVHGLLQTEAYARALRRAGLPPATPQEIDQWVSVRMRRQQRLTSPVPIALWVIMAESALRWQVGGPDVMAEQLRALVEHADRPNVTIQVLPYSAGAVPAMDAPFSLLVFEPTDPPVVYIETATDNLYLEDPQSVALHQLAIDHLRAAALPPADSVDKIRSIAERSSEDG
jgi:transcriptional regulator with XRE-family HTH domain